MSDTTTQGPAAGWYADPSGAEPFRWWDGGRWTAATVLSPPSAPEPVVSRTAVADGAVVGRAADGAFPSRRSLREAAAASTAGETVLPVTATPGVLPTAGWPTDPALPVESVFTAPASWSAQPPSRPFDAPVTGGDLAPRFDALGPRSEAPRPNHRASRGLYVGLFGMASLIARIAVTHTTAYYFVPIAAIFGIVASVQGLVQANRWLRDGYLPKGRRRSLVGLVLCSITLVAQCALTGLVLLSDSLPAAPVSQATSAPAGPAQTPEAGTAQDSDGTPTYVYSQALAQSVVSSALAQRLHITPNSVQCPASEPLVIGTTFQCSVALPTTGTTSVEATVVSEQGELEISAAG